MNTYNVTYTTYAPARTKSTQVTASDPSEAREKVVVNLALDFDQINTIQEVTQ